MQPERYIRFKSEENLAKELAVYFGLEIELLQAEKELMPDGEYIYRIKGNSQKLKPFMHLLLLCELDRVNGEFLN